MFVPSIKSCGAVLCLACLLLSGCGQSEKASQPAAPAEEPAPVEEKAPAYITAADDFSNLTLDNAETPVYDHYTLAQRRAKGLTTALPKITPYRDKKVAYLTFDDGPDEKNTAAVLDISSTAASGRFSARHCALCVSPCAWEQTVLISSSAAPGTPISVWLIGSTTSPTTKASSAPISAST